MTNNSKGLAPFTLVLIGFTFIVGIWFVWTNYFSNPTWVGEETAALKSLELAGQKQTAKENTPSTPAQPTEEQKNTAADKIITEQKSFESAITPRILSRTFSSSAILVDKNFMSLKNCTGAEAEVCQEGELKKIGASNDMVDFYRESGWGVMDSYVEDGSYALVDVFSPLAANSNHQYAFLAGKNLWYVMDTEAAKISGIDRLSKEFPAGREISFSNGEFIGLNKRGEAVFAFSVTTGCRVCGTGYQAAIGYKIDSTVPGVSASLLGFCDESQITDTKYPACSDKSFLE